MSNDLLKKSKLPSTSNNYLGIEIEFVSTKSWNAIAAMLVREKLEYNCQLGEDSSVRPSYKLVTRPMNIGYYDSARLYHTKVEHREVKEYAPGIGYELRVLCSEKELATILPKVGKILANIGAYVNETCGLHVHIDMRNRDVSLAAHRLLEKEKEMFNVVSPERKKNKYCKPSRYKSVAAGLTQGNYSRYKAVNLGSYKELRTIEVRLHEGTVKSKEIIDWCKYLMSIVDKRRATKGVKAYAKKRIKESRALAS